MKFVLFRHAHKGLMPFEDPELSPRGFTQAAAILNLIQEKVLPPPTRLCVSPRRRTSQTLYPVSRALGLQMETVPGLDQREGTETSAEFRARITSFVKDLRSAGESEIVYACTHYDWIEESMGLIDCDRDLSSFEF